MKWLDLSTCNASMNPISLGKGDEKKQGIIIIGDLNQDQKRTLTKDLGFYHYNVVSQFTVLVTTRYTRKSTGKISLKHVPFESIANIFNGSVIKDMDMKELSQFWPGMTKTTQNSIAAFINTDRAKRALDSYESIGLNEDGNEIFITPTNERFMFPANGINPDHILFYRGVNNQYFLKFDFLRLKDLTSAATGLIREMEAGRVVDQDRLDSIIETSGIGIRLGSLEAAKIQLGVIRQMEVLLLSDIYNVYNNTEIEQVKLTEINNIFTNLIESNRHKKFDSLSYEKMLSPAFGYLTRKFVESADSREYLTFINETSLGAMALLPKEIPIQLSSNKNTQIIDSFNQLGGNVSFTNIDLLSDQRIRGKVVIATPSYGLLENELNIDGVKTDRRDHAEALNICKGIDDDTKLMIIVNGDQLDQLGRISGESTSFHQYVFKNYNVVEMADVSPQLIGSYESSNYKRVYIINGKRLIESLTPAPSEIKVIYNINDLFVFSNGISNVIKEKEVELKTRDELIHTNSISDLLQNYTEAHKQSAKFELNFAQSQYVPLTRLVESKPSAQPINFVSASREASIKLLRDIGNPDQFFLEEIGLPIEHVQAIWDAEQIDALTMAIWRLKNKKPFLEADMTGKGKGRVLAGLIYWNVKRGVTPVFMTSSVDLLSDIWRDIRETKLDQYINPLFISNDDIVNKESKEIIFNAQDIIDQKDKVISKKLLPSDVGCNVIFSTYSQINTLNKSNKSKPLPINKRLNERAHWLLNTVNKQRSIIIADESHNVASTTSNQAMVFDLIVKGCSEPIIRSSATWSKDEKSIARCADMFPPEFTEEMLIKMVRRGGTSVQEVLATTLIAEGAMVRREHDFGQRQVEIIESQDYLKNRESTDVMAEIMIEARKYTKRQYEIMNTRIRGRHQNIQDVEEYSFASTFSLLADSFTNSMRSDECVRACITAINSNEKPIVGVDKHGGAALKYLYDILSENESEQKSFILDEFPSFKTMLIRWTKNEGSRKMRVRMPPTAAEIALAKKENRTPKDTIETLKVNWRDELAPNSDEYQELDELENAILEKIELMPFLPLSPIDYIKCQLESSGITSTEVSGRQFEIKMNSDGTYTLGNRDDISKAEAQFLFNSDQANVIFVTKAGTEGISLHAQEAFLKFSEHAANKRHVLLLGTFLYIIDEEQFFGRAERKGQVRLARFSKLTTGMPIESRLLALSERNRLKLSASTTGNSKSLKATATVPNFLNPFGDRVTAEFLFDNQYILDLLSFDDLKKEAIIQSGEKAERQNQIKSLTGTVLGRMMLLDYEQQQSLLDELSQYFNSKLGILQAKGLDPLNTKIIAGDVHVLREKVILGKSQNHYSSEFDKPVIGQDVEVVYKSRTIEPHVIENEIKLSKISLDKRLGIQDGRLSDFALRLIGKRQEILEHALLKTNNRLFKLSSKNNAFKNVSEALQSPTINHVKEIDNFLNKAIKLLKQVQIGDVVAIPSLNKSIVITGCQLPNEQDYYSHSNSYSFTATTTLGQESEEIYIESMFFYLDENPDNYKQQNQGAYDTFHPINEIFENISINGAKERFTLLTGNLLESSRINAEKTLGQQVTIKTKEGQVYSAVKLKKEYNLDRICDINFSAPVTLKSDLIKIVEYNLFNHGIAFEMLHRLDKEFETCVRLFVNRDPLFSVELPKTLAGRKDLDRQNPFNGIEIDRLQHDNRSDTYRRYRFNKSDMAKVIDILENADFKVNISMNEISEIRQAIDNYESIIASPKPKGEQIDIEDAIYSNVDNAQHDINTDIEETADPLDNIFNMR